MKKLELISVIDYTKRRDTHVVLKSWLFKNNVTGKYVVASSSKTRQLTSYPTSYMIDETMLFDSDMERKCHYFC